MLFYVSISTDFPLMENKSDIFSGSILMSLCSRLNSRQLGLGEDWHSLYYSKNILVKCISDCEYMSLRLFVFVMVNFIHSLTFC